MCDSKQSKIVRNTEQKIWDYRLITAKRLGMKTFANSSNDNISKLSLTIIISRSAIKLKYVLRLCKNVTQIMLKHRDTST